MPSSRSSVWTVKFSLTAERQLAKLDTSTQTRILKFLKQWLDQSTESPRRFGKPLAGVMAGTWRYRVGQHRIICEIRDHEIVVLVLAIGHLREIYR